MRSCSSCGANDPEKYNFKGNPFCSDKCWIAFLESEVGKIRTPEDPIWFESGVSARTGAGFVTIRWGSYAGQLECDKASEMAIGLLEAAMAADSDASMTKLFRKELELPPKAIQTLLKEMRKYRAIGKE